MKKLIRKRTIIISVLFLSIFILGFFQNAKISKAQPQYNNQNKTLTAPLSFSMYEFSEELESEENATSIDISLPSSSWNLTDIQVNFTDIDFNREVIVIEDEPDDSNFINQKSIKGIAVQINITEPTILYGVYIYGRAQSPKEGDIVDTQIQGYDGLNNRPNGIPIREVSLNMSTDLKWHYQNFSEPLLMVEGNYSLVINRTNIEHPLTRYIWYYSYLNPKNPDLHISLYGDGALEWLPGVNSTPQLYKLDQKLNFDFKPEEINMHAEINGDTYQVADGIDPVKGNLSIPNVDYSSSTDTLSISIKNNKSDTLLFNASYNFKLKNIFSAGGTVSIRESFNNTWIVLPIFNRPSNNYSIKFGYPKTWFNLTVFNSTGELTNLDDYFDDGEAIYIPNGTITADMGWKITANSEKVPFSALPQLTSYRPLQTIIIEVNTPSTGGNLTFVLLDKFGNLVYNDTIEYSSSSEEFSYTLSQNPFEGTWQALVFWNNETDAGLEINNLSIIVSETGDNGDDDEKTIITGIDPQLIYMTVLYIVIGSLVGLSSYKMVKRHKRAKAEHREKIFNKYMDLLNLDYIIIMDKKSGLNVFEQILAGKERDVSLISGFLEAIRRFGIELAGSEEETRTIRLEYQNMNILMSDFKNFRILNIMKEAPSTDFLDSLKPLSQDIDTYYGKSLKEFDGGVAKFRGIKDLIEEHLQTPLIYPLIVVMTKETKLGSAEKSLVNKSLNTMKKNNVDHFYVSYLMGKAKEFNVKNAEIILKLIQKKVFRPIE